MKVSSAMIAEALAGVDVRCAFHEQDKLLNLERFALYNGEMDLKGNALMGCWMCLTVRNCRRIRTVKARKTKENGRPAAKREQSRPLLRTFVYWRQA